MPPKGWKTITIREVLYELLKRLAEENDLSVTEQANKLFKEALEGNR